MAYARPSVDVDRNGSWRTEANGTTDLWQSINEEIAADADYIYWGINFVGDTFISMKLSTVTDPGSYATGIHLRWRGERDGGTTTRKVQPFIYDGDPDSGGTLLFTGVEETLTDGVWNTYEELDITGFDGSVDYSDLHVLLQQDGSNFSGKGKVSWFELEFETASENTITGTVTDWQRGFAIEGAVVTVSTASGSANEETDSSGDYSVAVGSSALSVVVTCDYFDWASSPASFKYNTAQGVTGVNFDIGPESKWPNDATPYAFRKKILFSTNRGYIPENAVMKVPMKTGNQFTFSRFGDFGEAIQHNESLVSYHGGKTFMAFRGDKLTLKGPDGHPTQFPSLSENNRGPMCGLLQIFDQDTQTFLDTAINIWNNSGVVPNMSETDTHYYPSIKVSASNTLHLIRTTHLINNSYYVSWPNATELNWKDGYLFDTYNDVDNYDPPRFVSSGKGLAKNTAIPLSWATYAKTRIDSLGRVITIGRSARSATDYYAGLWRVNLRRAVGDNTFYSGTKVSNRSSADWSFTYTANAADPATRYGREFIITRDYHTVPAEWGPVIYNGGMALDEDDQIHTCPTFNWAWTADARKQYDQGIMYIYSPLSDVPGISTPEPGHYWYDINTSTPLAICTVNTSQPFMVHPEMKDTGWVAQAWSTPYAQNDINYGSNTEGIYLHPNQRMTTGRGDAIPVPYVTFSSWHSAAAGSSNSLWIAWATPTHPKANTLGWHKVNLSTAIMANGYDSARVWYGRYAGQIHITPDDKIRVWGVTKDQIELNASTMASGELCQWTSSDNGATWDWELLTNDSEFGLGMYSIKQDYSNNEIEMIRTRGADVDYIRFNSSFPSMQKTGRDVSVYYGGNQIDRISNFWGYSSSKVIFKIQDNISTTYSFHTSGNYYVYHGKASTDSTVLRNPQNIYGIYENWESFDHKEIPLNGKSNVNWLIHSTGALIDGYDDWRVSGTYRNVWLATALLIDALAHPNKIYGQSKSLFMAGYQTSSDLTGPDFLHTTLSSDYQKNITFSMVMFEQGGQGGKAANWYMGFIYGDDNTAIAIGTQSKVSGGGGQGEAQAGSFAVYQGHTGSPGLNSANSIEWYNPSIIAPSFASERYKQIELVVSSAGPNGSNFCGYVNGRVMTDKIPIAHPNMKKIFFGSSGTRKYYIDNIKVEKNPTIIE